MVNTDCRVPDREGVGKKNLFGLTLGELEHFFTELGEKKFRAGQAFRWMYQRGLGSFDDMTDVSRDLRVRLAGVASIRRIVPVRIEQSAEYPSAASQKILFQLHDGEKVESVYIPDGDRRTVCVSTQAGCAVGCVFCATGWMGFHRNLSAAEIIDQVVTIRATIDPNITNVVFMGMGEPFLNYENVLQAAAIIASERGPAVAARRITMSTSGIIPRIYEYADGGHPFHLAISLNATTDAARQRIMPITKKYPLKDLLDAAKYYNRSRRRPVTLEYVLLAGVNDTEEDAARLKRIAADVGRSTVNVIPYNPIEGPDLRRPSEERIENFMKELAVIRSPLTLRRSRGQDISAACGQLAIRE